MNKELKAYYKSIEDLTKLFSKKYFKDCEWYWIDEAGGYIDVGNYYCYSMTNIEHAIKYKATKKEVIEYYEYFLEKSLKKEPKMNLENYLKYFRGFSWLN